MKFTTITQLCSPLIAILLVQATPISEHISARAVFAPPITFPHNGTVWTVGEFQTVLWDVSNAPADISNRFAQLYLKRPGMEDLALAGNIDITKGVTHLPVPANVPDGTHYQLRLIGDSGDLSDEFTIRH